MQDYIPKENYSKKYIYITVYWNSTEIFRNWISFISGGIFFFLAKELPAGSWQVVVGRWQLAGDSRQLTVAWWELAGRSWHVEVGRWQVFFPKKNFLFSSEILFHLFLAEFFLLLAKELLADSWQVLFSRWQLEVDSRQLTIGCWQLAGGSWQVEVGRWQVPSGRWHAAVLPLSGECMATCRAIALFTWGEAWAWRSSISSRRELLTFYVLEPLCRNLLISDFT